MNNILIISPSLDARENVSGISSITRLLIENNIEETYFHFRLGRKDCERRRFCWFFTQLKTPFLLYRFMNYYDIAKVHFNLGFEPMSLLRDITLFLFLSWQKKPLCLHIHGGRYMQTVPRNFLLKSIITLFLKRASAIIVLSAEAKNFLKRNYSSFIVSQISVVPNAVVIPVLNHQVKKYQDTLTIVFLGRIDRKKGLKVIAETLNLLTERRILYRFHLCGVGPDKEWFFGLLSQEAITSVCDQGLVFGKRKEELLLSAHIFFLPSFFEGLPMALLESMGYAVVPLVTPVGSIPEVVKDFENGFFIGNDADLIVERISFLDKNRDKLSVMGQQCRNLIEEEFSINNYVNRINEIYKTF